MSEKIKPKRVKPVNFVNPKVYTQDWLSNEAKVFLEWIQKPTNLYFKTFALERGYSPQRFPEFARDSEEFAEALEMARAWQESKIVVGALKNSYNAIISKFVLQNCHKWVDRISDESDNKQATEIQVTLHPSLIQNDNKDRI